MCVLYGELGKPTQLSWYQKGKTSLDFTEARDSEWQWHQLGHMQVCISLQTDNHASTPPLRCVCVTHTMMQTHLCEAEKELLRVRHVEPRQHSVVVAIVTEPRLQSIVADPQSTVVCNVLTKCRHTVRLNSCTHNERS